MTDGCKNIIKDKVQGLIKKKTDDIETKLLTDQVTVRYATITEFLEKTNRYVE